MIEKQIKIIHRAVSHSYSWEHALCVVSFTTVDTFLFDIVLIKIGAPVGDIQSYMRQSEQKEVKSVFFDHMPDMVDGSDFLYKYLQETLQIGTTNCVE